MSRVTAIIINYNGSDLLEGCIKSILDQDYDQSLIDIVVADNGSTDSSKELVEKFETVKFYETGGNLGIGWATNEVCKTVDTKYALLLNYDLKLFPDCISKAMQEFEKAENLFSVDLLQYDWEGENIVHTGQKVSSASFFSGTIPGIKFVQDINYEDVIFSCAGAMIFDREKFSEIGGFDERFFLEYEDVDLCIRAELRGWRSRFCKDAKLYHKIAASVDKKTFKGDKKTFSKIKQMRQISLRYNLFRMVIKLCGMPLVLKFAVREIAKIIIFALKGNFMYSKFHVASTIRVLLTLPDIINARKDIKKASKFSWDEVVNKYRV